MVNRNDNIPVKVEWLRPVTAVVVCIIMILSCAELASYLTTNTHTHKHAHKYIQTDGLCNA